MPLWTASRLANGLPDGIADIAVRRTLPGPWAFATEQDGVITVVRDPMGLMPAYWGRLPDGSVAVSDSIADLVDRGCDPTPDEDYSVAQANFYSGVLPTRTLVVGVHRVPPGCEVDIRVVDPDDPGAVRRWWRPEDAPAERRIGLADAAAELRALLRTVVDDVVVSMDGPIAAHVSGGLDSTTLAVLAAQALGERGRALALVVSWSPDDVGDLDGLDGLDRDERKIVMAVADSLGVPTMLSAGDVEVPGWLVAALPTQPDESLTIEASLLPRMAQAGIQHVVSGWGGDEFASFNGRGSIRAIVRRGRLALIRAHYARLRARGTSRARAIVELAKDGAPPVVRRRLPSIREAQRRHEDHVARVREESPEVALAMDRLHRAVVEAPSARATQCALYYLDHLARRVESWHEAGRRFGITYHYPLLDLRLVEWALSMPPEAWRIPSSRQVFRAAVDGIVDDRIRDSDKQDPVLFAVIRRARDAQAGPPPDAPTS